MPSLLEQLYQGKLNPDEKAVSSDPQYRELSTKVAETIRNWQEFHSEEEFSKLRAFLDLYDQTHEMELASNFTYGFRLGAGLMVEILTDASGLAQKLSAYSEHPPR
ncbi:MAG: hypothetical protein K0R57_2790 [Paenibacillaceae bacterium]|jgi:hypothetical protein|nr:hypothetical protein [Paenibacillaceae bacterium]